PSSWCSCSSSGSSSRASPPPESSDSHHPPTGATAMTNLNRRTLLGAAAGAGALTAAGSHAFANPGRGRPVDHDETLLTWARDTWRSLVAMTDPDTGLVADNIDGDLATRS